MMNFYKTFLSIFFILLIGNISAQGSKWTQVLQISGVLEHDYLGFSVDICDDYAVIGAPSLYGTPRVYVYHYDTTTLNWNKEAELTCTADGNSLFGTSVAISGDCIVVGDINYEHNRVFVFVKSGNSWEDMTETAKLEPSDNSENNYFGLSVDIDGDCIVVGAHADDTTGPSTGSAYVFVRPENGWSDTMETAKLTPSHGEEQDMFGGSVSIYGDNIAIGAPHNDDKGSVYLFEKPETGWVNMHETVKLTAINADADANFGVSVSLYDSYLAVGADSFGIGDAYIFKKQGENWNTAVQVAKLSSSNNHNDGFGSSISIYKDRIVVGARGDVYKKGRVYVFDKPEEGWSNMTENYIVFPLSGNNGDYFGCSVGVMNNHMIVGAFANNVNAIDSGSAYFFRYSDFSQTLENSSADFIVQPNPARDVVVIESAYNHNALLQITDMNGHVVMERKINAPVTKLNVSGLPNGVYLVNISAAGKIYKTKFVKN